jgi:transposase
VAPYVAPYVARVVAVNPNQSKVISHSVKKTDPNDARNLALYLEKDLLPEVRMKDKTQAQLASLTQTRDTLVKLRTSLKNKINNILSAHGINLEREALSSEKKLNEVLAMKFDAMVKDRTGGDRRGDPQPEREDHQAGEGDRRRREQAGRAQELDQHQGHRPVERKHSAFGDRRYP